MVLRRFLLVLAALFFAVPLPACIWSYGTNLQGKQVQVDGLAGADLVVEITQRTRRGEWIREKKTYLINPKSDHESRNDYAVALLHLGETAEAIRILQAIEKERPGLYPTAANLGTAFELSGKDADALRWIRESIRRNPLAHNQTEWLHLRILEAKLARAKDPKWLATHSVLGLDFGTDVLPRLPKTWPRDNVGKPANAQSVNDALYLQLSERLEFINAPDPIVADLFFDWANLNVRTGVLENAEAFYLQALGFGLDDAPLAKKRLAHVQSLLKSAKAKKKK